MNLYAIDFESGSSQYAQNTSFSGGPDINVLTVSQWFKLESLPSSGVQYTLNTIANATFDSVTAIYNNSGTYQIRKWISGANVYATWNLGFTPSTGVWYGVAVSQSGVSSRNAYIWSGGSITDLGTNTDTQDNAGAITTFRVAGHGSDYFDGEMADVRVFSTALTSGNLTDVFQNDYNVEPVAKYYVGTQNSNDTHGVNNLTATNSPTFVLDYPYSLTGVVTQEATAIASGSGTSLTYSHTCSGEERYLAVSVGTHVNQGAVSGVTYNGVAMTNIGTEDGNNNTRIQLWGLANPATGANNVVISKAGSTAIRAMSYSFIGVDQTNPVNTSNVFPRSSWTGVTTFNPSVTASVTGCLGVLAFFADSGNPLTAGTNTWYETPEATAFGQSIGRNVVSVSGTTVQLTITCSPSQGFGGVLAALAPTPVGGFNAYPLIHHMQIAGGLM